MTSTELLLAVHACATVAMAGLIWFVQIVHYPLMLRVGAAGFRGYAGEHARRTTLVVAPLMLMELGTAVRLALVPPAPELAWASTAGLALLVPVWLSTALLQVPCHRALGRGLDPAVVRRLVATNWLRTLAWTARAALAIHLAIAGS